MYNPDFRKLSRKELLEHFERERQEWLNAGMSEADIFRIHFGEENEDGRGGDYRMWLDERKHVRPDHTYAPGIPVAIDTVDPNGAWISDGRSGLDEVEFNIDFESALSKLTELQRFCFIEICVRNRTYREIAAERKKSLGTITDAVFTAKKKLKNFFI